MVRRLYTITTIGSNFIIRQKSSLQYEIVDGEDLLDRGDNVLLDQTISLTGYQTRKKYPVCLRRIVYYAPELKRTFTFLTNNFELKAKDSHAVQAEMASGTVLPLDQAASQGRILVGQDSNPRSFREP